MILAVISYLYYWQLINFANDVKMSNFVDDSNCPCLIQINSLYKLYKFDRVKGAEEFKKYQPALYWTC